MQRVCQEQILPDESQDLISANKMPRSRYPAQTSFNLLILLLSIKTNATMMSGLLGISHKSGH